MGKEESVFFKGTAPGRRAITPVVDPIQNGKNKLDALNYIKKERTWSWEMECEKWKILENMIKIHCKKLSKLKKGSHSKNKNTKDDTEALWSECTFT